MKSSFLKIHEATEFTKSMREKIFEIKTLARLLKQKLMVFFSHKHLHLKTLLH